MLKSHLSWTINEMRDEMVKNHVCVYCSRVHPTGPGSPTLTWSWWTPTSLSSLEREQCCGRSTLWVCTTEACMDQIPCCLHLHPVIQKLISSFRRVGWILFTVYCMNRNCMFTSVWFFQTTGRLKIGTYTGPLQHGIVYSGGKYVVLFWLSKLIYFKNWNIHTNVSEVTLVMLVK